MFIKVAWAAGVGFDYAFCAPDLAIEPQLTQSIIDSLFTDARAQPGDLPSDMESGGGDLAHLAPLALDADLRGWWGNSLVLDGETPHEIGSRLWTLTYWPMSDGLVTRAGQLAAEALQWMVVDGIAAPVGGLTVLATRDGAHNIRLDITITAPNGRERLRQPFLWLWDQIG